MFLTGQPSVIPGLPERLHSILQSLLPPGSKISVQRAAEPALDAWNGMAAYSRTPEFMSGQCAVTRADYDEFGGERVKRWWGGNWNGDFGAREGKEMDVDA